MTIFRQSLACLLAAGAIAGPAGAWAAEPTGGALISGVYTASDPVSLVKAQWMWRGRNYCWYLNGWRGPGYYWCGYAWRRGLGWGGPAGWHGWRYDRGHDQGWHRGWRNQGNRDRNGAWRGQYRDQRDHNQRPEDNGHNPH